MSENINLTAENYPAVTYMLTAALRNLTCELCWRRNKSLEMRWAQGVYLHEIASH